MTDRDEGRTPGAMLLALAVVALPGVALLASGLLDDVYTVIDSSWRSVTVVDGNAARNVQIIGAVGTSGLALHVLNTEIRRGRRPGVLLPLAALIVTASILVRSPEPSILLGTLSALITLTAATVVRLDHRTMRAIGWYAVAFLASNWLFYLGGFPQATKECRDDKCSYLGVMLQGYTQHEQTLGLYAALLTPALAFLPPKIRRPAVIFVVLTIFATASRTAFASLAVALLAYWLLEGTADAGEGSWDVRRGQPALRQLLAFTPLAALVAALVLFLALPPAALTGRGQVWAVIRDGVSQHPLFGPGRAVLEHGYDVGQLDFVAHTEHSEAGYLLAVGGVITLLLFLAVLTQWSVDALRWGQITVLFALAPALSFATEAPWTINAFSSTYWTLFVCVALHTSAAPAPSVAPVNRQNVLNAVRRVAPTVLTCGVVGLLAGVTFSLAGPRAYQSTSSLLLTTSTTGTDDLWESTLLAQDLSRSYARAATSPVVLAEALEDLGWTDDPATVAEEVVVQVPKDTAVMRITVRQPTSERAQQLAGAVATSAAAVLPRLGSASGDGGQQVHATVTGHGSTPTSATVGGLLPSLFDGFSVGVILGVLIAAAGVGRTARLKDEAQARHIAGPHPVVSLTPASLDTGGHVSMFVRHTLGTTGGGAVFVTSPGHERMRSHIARLVAEDTGSTGLDVCLVDLDPPARDLRADRRGLSELLLGNVGLDDLTLTTDGAVAVLTPGERPEILDIAPAERIRETMRKLTARFDAVLVTGAPRRLAFRRTLASSASAVVVVAEVRRTRVADFRRVLTDLEEDGSANIVLVTTGRDRWSPPADLARARKVPV